MRVAVSWRVALGIGRTMATFFGSGDCPDRPKVRHSRKVDTERPIAAKITRCSRHRTFRVKLLGVRLVAETLAVEVSAAADRAEEIQRAVDQLVGEDFSARFEERSAPPPIH